MKPFILGIVKPFVFVPETDLMLTPPLPIVATPLPIVPVIAASFDCPRCGCKLQVTTAGFASHCGVQFRFDRK